MKLKKDFFEKKLNISNKKLGATSIIFAILVLSVILFVALGVSALMFRQFRSISEATRSIKAFYAADSGAERCFYQFQEVGGTGQCKSIGIGNSISELLGNGSQYTAYRSDENGGNQIISTGIFSGTSRRIELNW